MIELFSLLMLLLQSKTEPVNGSLHVIFGLELTQPQGRWRKNSDSKNHKGKIRSQGWLDVWPTKECGMQKGQFLSGADSSVLWLDHVFDKEGGKSVKVTLLFGTSKCVWEKYIKNKLSSLVYIIFINCEPCWCMFHPSIRKCSANKVRDWISCTFPPMPW